MVVVGIETVLFLSLILLLDIPIVTNVVSVAFGVIVVVCGDAVLCDWISISQFACLFLKRLQLQQGMYV